MNDAEDVIRKSWLLNASAWTRAVREGRIESRRLATDRAIVEAVVEESPRRVLDMGCGEGWLARALAARGIDVTGVDASEALIHAARELEGGHFVAASFAEIAADASVIDGPFDVVVFNFSLFEKEIEGILSALPALLTPGGVVLIQTVHPVGGAGPDSVRSEPVATGVPGQSGAGALEDGWRTESFDGFDPPFIATMPWYFRTPDSWSRLLAVCGLTVETLVEPVRPDTSEPASLIIRAVVAGEDGSALRVRKRAREFIDP